MFGYINNLGRAISIIKSFRCFWLCGYRDATKNFTECPIEKVRGRDIVFKQLL